jgi:hypothetical protein
MQTQQNHNGYTIGSPQTLTSLPLEVNLNRYLKNINDRNQRATSRMKKLHNYLEDIKDDDGITVGNKKERFLYLNDNLYQAETKRKLEAREINDQEKKAFSRRAQHVGLNQQIHHHTEVKKNEEQVKNFMLQQAKMNAFAED